MQVGRGVALRDFAAGASLTPLSDAMSRSFCCVPTVLTVASDFRGRFKMLRDSVWETRSANGHLVFGTNYIDFAFPRYLIGERSFHISNMSDRIITSDLDGSCISTVIPGAA